MERKIDIDNIALQSHALFYDPAYLGMKIFTDKDGKAGPRHTVAERGVQVHENGDVTFCYYAPNAKSVEVAGTGGFMTDKHHAMTKDENGFWHVTVSGIPAGFHYHLYFVDGTAVGNPQAPFGYGSHQVMNFFEQPDADSGFYLQQEVPHGTIRMEHYPSSSTGKTRICYVYTPPEYRDDSEVLYPVLYLHHGGGETETGWIWQGKINYIMDNLLAQGLCKPMLIVMNCLWAVDEKADFVAGDYDSVLVKDCIPFIEQKYRADKRDVARAAAGLSMGSYHTVMTTLGHLGMFPWVGVFSGSIKRRWYSKIDPQAILSDTAAFKAKMKLWYVGVGEQEPIYEDVTSTARGLAAQGLPVVLNTWPGYHEWTIWRKCAYEFLQLIFK
jgi:enterochelin esterase-like enzyme